MFDGLVTRDTRNGVHLELAEATDWLDDKTLQVRLRQAPSSTMAARMTADDCRLHLQPCYSRNAIDYPEAHTSPARA